MSAPVLDLLRQRREELGLEPLSGALAERRSVVRRGVLIGGGFGRPWVWPPGWSSCSDSS
jgi:hypothetical protein